MDKFLENNMLAKGVAFLVAVMLWMIVSLDNQTSSNVGQTIGTTTIDNVKLEVVYDSELYALQEVEDTVKVILTGRRSLLNINVFRTNQRVYIDLTDLGEGRHRVKVLHEGFPRELRVEIEPAYVEVVLEKKEVRSFPVKIDLSGVPKEGFSTEEPIMEQEEVHVIAPASVLDQVATVRGFVNVDHADQLIKQDVLLKAYDHFGNELPVEISPSSIRVEVPIQSPSKLVPWQLRMVNQLPHGISLVNVETNLKEVRVYAPLEELEKIDKLEQNLNLATIGQSGTVVLDIPLKKGWYATYPKQVEVKIEVDQTVERVFSNIPIQVKGLAEGLAVEFIDPEDGFIDLVIQGSKERLDKLRPEQIMASIDLQRANLGEQTVRLQVEMTQGSIYYQVAKQVDVQVHVYEATVETTVEGSEEGQEESENDG